MRKLVSIVLLSAACITMQAVPASTGPVVRYYEDGTADTVYIYGDEFASYTYPARERHARLPRLQVQAPQQQMRAAYVPASGKVRVPVILVNFTDRSFTIDNPKDRFDDLFNGNGGSNPNATGSVHNYFAASSNGALDLEYEVLGPYTLSHEMVYYGDNKTNSQGVTTDHNVRANELVIEAVQLAFDNGADFSRYDANNDGYIDNISVVVAGYNEAEGGKKETIWPHYSTILNGKRYNNKYTSGYLIISEYRGSGGQTQAGIGTYCHEFGHALGLPDLYNTESSNAYTVGEWDVMCLGCYNNSGSTPPTYTAFERFFMGWLTPEQVSTPGLKTLHPIETHNEALLIAAKTHNINPLSPNPTEYFLLENRQALGWDAGNDALVSTGMLVSHITFNSTKWENNTFNNSTPLGFAIVSAGMDSPTKSTAADVFPGSTRRTSWKPTLNNGTVLYDRSVSQIRQHTDGNIGMYIGAGGENQLSFLPDELEVSTQFLQKPVAYDTAVATLHIPSGKQDSLLLYVESGRFRFSPDSGTNWYSYPDTAVLPITRNHAYNQPVWVVYNPLRQSCSYTYSFLTVNSPDDSIGTQLTLKGIAPGPTMITTPVIDSTTAISSHSFNIHWQEQDAADGYYYSLYTIQEGSSQETEEFEEFSTIAQIKERGWDANFANIQTTVAQSGNAIAFYEDKQYIQTPKYTYSPTQLVFWLSNNYTPDGNSTTGGRLLVSGSADGKEWTDLTTVTVQRSTKKSVRTIDLDTALHMRRFRIAYTHLGGNGGPVIDSWSVTYPFDLTYIYAPREHVIHGSSIQFRDLSPNTAYYYTMQAYEMSGCEPHYSDYSTPVLIQTKEIAENPELIVNRIAAGKYSVRLPDLADEKHYLAVYDYTGHLIHRLRPLYGELTVELPALPMGQLYMVKYYSESMKRKDLNTKILSR